MTTIKKEAAKDVATFATISEVSKSLTDTKAVLNQVVILPCTKCTGICVAVVSSYGIQKWMSTWKAWMRLLMK